VSAVRGPRHELASLLAERCRRHHLVVWDDPAKHYESVVDVVVPEGWAVERYAGSWWDLRRRIEGTFSGAEPPKLVVYVPAAPPAADPLEEIRRAGTSFKRLLPTVLKDALAGELGATRIAELGSRCPTLAAAEDALEGGTDLDPALIAELGVRDAEQALARVILGEVELSPDARGALASLVQTHLGAEVEADGLRSSAGALIRHLLLAAVAHAAGDGTVSKLVPAWEPLTPQQHRHASDLVERASRPDTLSRWGELADRAAEELNLSGLGWHDDLIDCDVARFVDDLAFAEAARLLPADRGGAFELATRRQERSRWLRWRDTWSTRLLTDFEAVRSIAHLHQRLDEHRPPPARSLGELHRWYAEGAWQVDRAHRSMETARFGLSRPGLDMAFTAARQAYLDWLDSVLDATSRAAAASPDTEIEGQAGIVANYVIGHGKTAFVIVDALRLELGHRLAELLEGTKTASSHVTAAVALPPTITQVGMANLLPDAASRGVSVELDGESLTVRVGSRTIRTVEDRTAEYRRAAGRVEDHRLSDWLGLGDDVLADRIGNSDLSIVRSQEIDAAGEQGLATVRWSQIDFAVEALATLIGRLTTAGVERVVVTADHGFLALGRPLDPSRVRPNPTGQGVVVHGRAWVGRPATLPEGCTALALADLGIDSQEQLVVTDGMTVFGSAGAGFFHGGISPQEALVPVVVIDATGAGAGATDLLAIDIGVPGGRISAEAFSTRISLGGSLFATDLALRVTATGEADHQLARLVPGEAVDPHTGTVHLDPGTEAILTFLITENVDKGQVVQIAVLDAATGRQIATNHATVARDLRPEDDW
jgi:hypothetical protein